MRNEATMGEMVVAIDTSASVGQNGLSLIVGHLNTILEQVKPELEVLVIDKFVGGNLSAAKADETLSLFIVGALKSLWRSFVNPSEGNALRAVSASAVDGTKTFVINGYEVTIKKVETV